MSTEQWDDQRLDRLASLAENNARAIEDHNPLFEKYDRVIEDHNRLFEKYDRLIESNARILQALNVAAESREERQQLFQNIAQQQTEIRGMQAENRRILDILLNDRARGDNPI